MAIDPHDGGIVALVGGYDFRHSKFNRAVDASRQPGSVFKPFVFSAALDHGMTAATIVNDAPVVIDDPTAGTIWRPRNYSGTFGGPTPLRQGLVRSNNIVSVRALRRVGLPAAIEHMRAFGLPESSLEARYSLALGAGGAAPLEIARGYAVFANGGYRVEPWLIERIERNGLLFQAEPAVACAECALADEYAGTGSAATAEWLNGSNDRMPSRLAHAFARIDRLAALYPEPAGEDEPPPFDSVAQMQAVMLQRGASAMESPELFTERNLAPRAVSAENAYIVYDMMRDVVRSGTGRSARELGRQDLAGKTGTTNDNRDAWFSGFNGDLLATVWVGFDQELLLGRLEEGGRTALPIWIYFMEKALDGAPESPLPRPRRIISARVSPETGLLAPPGRRGCEIRAVHGRRATGSFEAGGTGGGRRTGRRTLLAPGRIAVLSANGIPQALAAFYRIAHWDRILGNLTCRGGCGLFWAWPCWWSRSLLTPLSGCCLSVLARLLSASAAGWA